MTEINRKLLSAFRADADEALAAVAKKHGVTAKIGNCTFEANFATFKLKIAVVDKNGIAASPEAENFKRLADVYGFKASDLGKTFATDQGTYKLVGLNTRRQKFPILGERADGKRYKLSIAAVKRGLGAA